MDETLVRAEPEAAVVVLEHVLHDEHGEALPQREPPIADVTHVRLEVVGAEDEVRPETAERRQLRRLGEQGNVGDARSRRHPDLVEAPGGRRPEPVPVRGAQLVEHGDGPVRVHGDEVLGLLVEAVELPGLGSRPQRTEPVLGKTVGAEKAGRVARGGDRTRTSCSPSTRTMAEGSDTQRRPRPSSKMPLGATRPPGSGAGAAPKRRRSSGRAGVPAISTRPASPTARRRWSRVRSRPLPKGKETSPWRGEPARRSGRGPRPWPARGSRSGPGPPT